MKTRIVLLIAGLACGARLAMAQPGPAPPALPGLAPAENVIVTAPKLSGDAVRDFVQSYAAPSPALDKIARWKDGICPVTAGLRTAALNAFVTRRVREVAAQAGAPVAKEGCRFNIDIVFTIVPQALLDQVREKEPAFLGYHDVSRAARIATVSHPVQAWYASQTEDMNGMRSVDDPGRTRGVDLRVPPGMDPAYPAGYSLNLPFAREQRVQATRLGDGLASVLYHVVIVVDLKKIQGEEIGPVADYIAMLALSQARSFDTCLDEASIANLMAPDCDASRKANAITGLDLAYLRALYRMDLGGNLLQQRHAIAGQIERDLDGH